MGIQKRLVLSFLALYLKYAQSSWVVKCLPWSISVFLCMKHKYAQSSWVVKCLPWYICVFICMKHMWFSSVHTVQSIKCSWIKTGDFVSNLFRTMLQVPVENFVVIYFFKAKNYENSFKYIFYMYYHVII